MFVNLFNHRGEHCFSFELLISFSALTCAYEPRMSTLIPKGWLQVFIPISPFQIRLNTPRYKPLQTPANIYKLTNILYILKCSVLVLVLSCNARKLQSNAVKYSVKLMTAHSCRRKTGISLYVDSMSWQPLFHSATCFYFLL